MLNINFIEVVVRVAVYLILSLFFIFSANGMQRAVFRLRRLGK